MSLQDLDGSRELQQARTTLQPILLLTLRVVLKSPFRPRVIPHASSVLETRSNGQPIHASDANARWEGCPQADVHGAACA
jgi:hypothetical protein